jgi:phosphatidylglycerol:prolipoprotein diacylglycerol transferase
MHPYVFQTDLFSLRWENVLMMVGILAGLLLAYRRAAVKGEAYQDMLLDLAIYMVPAGFIGARVWELFWTWEAYREAPWEMLYVWNGGMSIQGAVLGGLVVAILFARSRRVRVWDLLDLLAPSAILGQGIGRIGCLLSGDAFGLPIREVPWLPQWLGLVYAPESPAGALYGSTPLIPAEAFEALFDFAILGLLLRIASRRTFPGQILLTYAILYSLARFSLEFLRADSLLVGGLKVAQLLSAAVMLLAVALWVGRRRATAVTPGVPS